MKKEIRLIFSGVGGVVKNLTRLLQDREEIRIVGALTRNADYAGTDLGAHAGIAPLDVPISADRDHVFG